MDLTDYGGACAIRGGVERATETTQRSAGCTQGANPILSIAAIVASNSGDLVRGAFGVQAPTRPVFSLRVPPAIKPIREALLV